MFARWVFWLLCLVLGLGLFTLFTLARQRAALSGITPREERYSHSLRLGRDWFANLQTAEGDFQYEIDRATGQSRGGNNIVRQAGSLYALAQYARLSDDPQTRQLLRRGVSYFSTLAQRQEDGSVAIRHENLQKSNAAALLLLALVEYEEKGGGESSEYQELGKGLADYLVTTQTPNGSFLNQLEPAPLESDYNNGESLYALIRAYRLWGDPRYLTSAQRAADRFIQMYGDNFNASFYSWGMAGFAHLYQAYPQEKYWLFLRQSTERYLQQRGQSHLTYLREKRGRPPRPSTAVFLEGVAHVAWVAKEKDPLFFQTLQEYQETTLNFLLRYQVGSDFSPLEAEFPTVVGGVCNDLACESLRIDFTQHLMSAQYLTIRYLQ